jgi:hypothetical protein
MNIKKTIAGFATGALLAFGLTAVTATPADAAVWSFKVDSHSALPIQVWAGYNCKGKTQLVQKGHYSSLIWTSSLLMPPHYKLYLSGAKYAGPYPKYHCQNITIPLPKATAKMVHA